MVWLLSMLPGVVLLGGSMFFILALFRALFANPQVLFQMALLGLPLVFLWWIYMQLPGFLRKALTSLFIGRRDRNGHHDH